MRLLRLRLRHYRGCAERELAFAPSGVTLVVGPNETGKSSLIEAIDLVFDELDGTTKQRVKNVQPVDRDEGAEVEVEVETGEYRFTLRKRFQRRPLTELHVSQPSVENWTGREAHQRVREILDATIDPELWGALRVQQGQALEQASWLGSPTLAHALDRAAGTTARGDREESLLEAAEAERARYFTKTGRERRELAASAKAVADAEAEVAGLAQALERLEHDIERSAALREQRTALLTDTESAEAALRQREREFEPVEGLREVVAAAGARRDAALAEEREALQSVRQRSQLVASHAAAEADRAHRSEELETGEPALLAARAELDHAEQAIGRAREAFARAETDEAAARRDVDLRRALDERAQLREREARANALHASITEARDALESLPLDEASVEAIREAELEVERAAARVESEGPLVRITPHAPLEASLDGRSTSLPVGDTREMRVADALTLELPGFADLTVVAGAAAATRLKDLEERRTRLRTLCMEHGVDDHAQAVQGLATRRELERRRTEDERALASLRDEDGGARLPERIARLTERVAQLEAEREPGFRLGADSAAADAALQGTLTARESAQRELERAQERRETLDQRHRGLADHHKDTALRLQLAEESFRDLDARLVAARSEGADEVLRRDCEGRSARARAAEAEWRDAARRLDEVGLDEAEARLASARAEREERGRALRAAQDESLEVQARLDVRGQDGLYEQHEEAARRGFAAQRAHASLRRRVDAARRLHTVLCEERDAMRRGYATPLQTRIEELGRLVFGESFAVELDEELRVTRRILDGASLAFDQLSAGAREQIALLVRLACASLVGPDGGAPVVLDDALGHSDADRLERLGEVLTRVSRECQIVVLTSAPERYAKVRDARLVRLN